VKPGTRADRIAAVLEQLACSLGAESVSYYRKREGSGLGPALHVDASDERFRFVADSLGCGRTAITTSGTSWWYRASSQRGELTVTVTSRFHHEPAPAIDDTELAEAISHVRDVALCAESDTSPVVVAPPGAAS
jgi:hypothetical protein